MKWQQRASQNVFKLPPTKMYSALDNKLVIALRGWGGPDAAQGVIDEITQYISATQADLELTTPFTFIEGISQVANRLRISVLLANDRLFKIDNKEFYSAGFEIMVLYQNKNEVAWLCFGNFSIHVDYVEPTMAHQTQLNDSALVFASHDAIESRHVLPNCLLGIDRQPQIQVGSLLQQFLNRIVVKSNFSFGRTQWTLDVSQFD